jgi:hypothetical protein
MAANTLLYQLPTSPVVRLDPSATKSAEKREGVGRHRSLIYISFASMKKEEENRQGFLFFNF